MAESRNRKHEHELTQSDFDLCPFWEYALDEEGMPGQDETTMRPVPDARGVDRETSFGILGATFRLANGREFFGWLNVGSGIDGPYGIDAMRPLIVLGPEDEINLSLPYERFLGVQAARARASLCYTRLGCDVHEVFPITIVPKLPIKGMGQTLQVLGFMRPAQGGNIEVVL